MDEQNCELSYGEGHSHTERPFYLVTVNYVDERPEWWTSACRKCAALCVDYYRPSDGVASIRLDAFSE